MDGGAWWAAVRGVAQSQTRLKQLSMHACIGEGNGSPLQCSCLENPRDGGAWWAAVYGHDWSDLAAAAECHLKQTLSGALSTKVSLKAPLKTVVAMSFSRGSS